MKTARGAGDAEDHNFLTTEDSEDAEEEGHSNPQLSGLYCA